MTVDYTAERSDAVRRALIQRAAAPRRPARGLALAGAAAAVVAGAFAVGAQVGGTDVAATAPAVVLPLRAAGADPAASPPADALPEEVAAASVGLEYFDELSVLPGFVAGGGDPDGRYDLEVYWDGPLGAAAAAVVADAEAHRVTVSVVQAAHSDADAWAAALRLVKALDEAGVEVGSFGSSGAMGTITVSGPVLSTDEAVQEQVRDLAATTIGHGYDVVIEPDVTRIPAVVRNDG